MESFPRTTLIAPDPECLKEVVACQCNLGNEKVFTAPPIRRVQVSDNVTRFPTAPCARETDIYKCPTTHILVTFKSPKYPDEVFNKVFPYSTPIKLIRRKIAKYVRMSYSNIVLTQNRTTLKDESLLCEVNSDAIGQVTIDVFAKDKEFFTLSAITKDNYVEDLLKAIAPEKKAIQFVAIKFKIRNQNGIFTRSYHSIMKVHEVKKTLAALFQCEPDNLILLREDAPLLDRMALMDLDYDIYGNIDLELLTKNGEKLRLEKVYKEIPINDVMTVMVPIGTKLKKLNVEIFYEPIHKPFLGGYKNIHTGIHTLVFIVELGEVILFCG